MLYKSIAEVPSFRASDDTILQEVVHPKNDPVVLPYSLAHASLEPGCRSLPHILRKSDELYIIVSGEGLAFLAGEEVKLKAGDVLLIPAGSEQYVVNTGAAPLRFLCIVSPPWSAGDEAVRP